MIKSSWWLLVPVAFFPLRVGSKKITSFWIVEIYHPLPNGTGDEMKFRLYNNLQVILNGPAHVKVFKLPTIIHPATNKDKPGA